MTHYGPILRRGVTYAVFMIDKIYRDAKVELAREESIFENYWQIKSE